MLVLGFGNPGRGDDGLGPLLVEQLEERVDADVTLLTTMQLQPEHIFDLDHHEQVLLVDAGLNTPAPFAFEPLQPCHDSCAFSHALSPWTLLAVYRDTLKKTSPPAHLLTIRGQNFELGESLSPQAHEHLCQALSFVESWLANARVVAG